MTLCRVRELLVQVIDMRFTPLLGLLVVLTPAARGSEIVIALGQSIFNGQSSVTRGQARLFNATSCGSCHNGGAGGSGPAADGPVPVALVIQLGSRSDADEGGDPIYGRVFNTAAADGVQAEGVATVRYSEIEGHYYPEAFRWRMRVPHYRLTNLSRGPLAAATVIKPRLAPSLFGAGLLEAVPENAITHIKTGPNVSPGEPVWHLYRGSRVLGRFGWQAASVSMRDQTTKAFAREMGLTSPDQPYDDCTPAEADCLRTRNDGSPAISADSISTVLAYLGALGVPESPMRSEQFSSGLKLFTDLGCAVCHTPALPVDLSERGSGSGTQTPRVIEPYTDLLLHDLGIELADQTATGARVPTKWRTAPLWGLGYRMRYQHPATFLHDGRARSVEEAILWHSGEAARAQHSFLNSLRRRREALLRWLEML